MLGRVDAIENLPVLSEHHAHLRRLVRDDGSTLNQISALIERDPSFAANLIRLSNSPIYGQARQVETVRRAIQVIGFRGVGEMSLVMELVKGFPFPSAMERTLFWDHALNVALIAKDLLAGDREESDRGYTVGLLHDVGLLVLANYLPDEFSELVGATGGPEALTIHDACRRRFDCTPLDVSVRLMQRWNFAASLWRPLAAIAEQTTASAPRAVARTALAVRQSHSICERHDRGRIEWDRLDSRITAESAVPAEDYAVVEGISAAILACC